MGYEAVGGVSWRSLRLGGEFLSSGEQFRDRRCNNCPLSHREDANGAKGRANESDEGSDRADCRAGGGRDAPHSRSPVADVGETLGTSTRLPRQLERPSDQGRHQTDGQWVMSQLVEFLGALCVLAVNFSIQTNRAGRLRFEPMCGDPSDSSWEMPEDRRIGVRIVQDRPLRRCNRCTSRAHRIRY